MTGNRHPVGPEPGMSASGLALVFRQIEVFANTIEGESLAQLTTRDWDGEHAALQNASSSGTARIQSTRTTCSTASASPMYRIETWRMQRQIQEWSTVYLEVWNRNSGVLHYAHSDVPVAW